MELTKQFVKAKNPCPSGYRWFIRDHNGHGDYQAILDALVADGRIDDACWLLDQFGPVDTILRLDTVDAHAIVFAGTLEVRSGITVDTLVRAGRHLCTGGGIRAGTAIVAGSDIEAAGNLASGGHIRPAATSRPAGASKRPPNSTRADTAAPSGTSRPAATSWPA